MSDSISSWILEQAPVIVVMGVVIWWLAKQLVYTNKQKEQLSKEVIKITTLWEVKADKIGENDNDWKKEVVDLLKEIKTICEN
tara:strand:+ start:2600 stop:2848 length:249 start_codon:yes stop_codon:yes gene_type:complete